MHLFIVAAIEAQFIGDGSSIPLTEFFFRQLSRTGNQDVFHLLREPILDDEGERSSFEVNQLKGSNVSIMEVSQLSCSQSEILKWYIL